MKNFQSVKRVQIHLKAMLALSETGSLYFGLQVSQDRMHVAKACRGQKLLCSTVGFFQSSLARAELLLW